MNTATKTSIWTLISIALGSALMASALLLAPAIAGQLIAQFGFSEVQIGWLISAELAGLSIASLPAMYWLNRVNWHHVLRISLLIIVFGNLLSTFSSSFEELLVVRLVTALFAGNVMVITMQTASLTDSPTRSYSVWVIGQLCFGTIGLAVLPFLFAKFDIQVLYALLALFSLGLMLTIKHFPTGLNQNQTSTTGLQRPSIAVSVLAVSGLLCFYISIGGIWTFAEQYAVTNINSGDTQGFKQTIGLILSVASAMGIVGAIMAGILTNPRYRLFWVTVGIIMLSGSMGMQLLSLEIVLFAVSLIVFKFAWTFTLPFVLAGFSSIDRSGILVTISNIVIGMGLAFGPVLAGYLIAFNDNRFDLMILVMTLMAFCSMVLIVTALWNGVERHSHVSD